jgi:WD40 repeat protein
VQIWDASNGIRLLAYTGHVIPNQTSPSLGVTDLAWSPDGKRIVSAVDADNGTVQVWDVSSGSLLLPYNGHTNIVDSVAWSPDGMRIASASHDTTVQVWWML